MSIDVRYEEKYFLTPTEVAILRDKLALIANPDPHAIKKNKYPVLSLYYDTPLMDFYHQKIQGEKIHEKIRLRTYSNNFYGPNSIIALEAKLKNQQLTKKIRHLTKDFEWIKESKNWWGLRSDASFFSKYTNLRPTCLVYYEREAYSAIVEGERIRITLDSCLQGKKGHKIYSSFEKREDLLKGKTICELKFQSYKQVDFISFLFKNMSVRKTSYSKYAEVVDFLTDRRKNYEF